MATVVKEARGLILLADLLAGCGSSTAEAPPLVLDKPADYAGWPALTEKPVRVSRNVFLLCSAPAQVAADMKPRGPHFVPAVKYFADPAASRALKGRSAAMPVGSVVVKEKWWNEAADRPDAFAAMVKRERGYDPENGDWEYRYVDLEGGTKPERGRLESCIACQRAAESTDYLFRSYLKE